MSACSDGFASARGARQIVPKRRAQLKLQGAYMGIIRQLGPRAKPRVQAVKEKRGFEAAIGIASRALQGTATLVA